MAVKTMVRDQELWSRGTCRGALQVVNGYVIRSNFEGVTTLYIYGACCGETTHAVEVREVEDSETRDRVRAEFALWKGVPLEDVVWAKF